MRLQNDFFLRFGCSAIAVWFYVCKIDAQPVFSGEVFLNVQSSQLNGNITLFISPRGLRADFPEKSLGSILVPSSSPVAFRINSTAKTYTEIDLREQKRLSGALAKLEKFELKQFQDDTLLGYRCFHFLLKSSQRTIELWTSPMLMGSSSISRLNDAAALFGLNGSVIELMQKETIAGFPMRVVAVEPSGNFEMRVSSVKPKVLKSALFELPKSYREMQSE